MKSIQLTLLFICLAFATSAQDLLSSRETSPFTYIFQISDAQAKEAYANTYWQIPETFFHTLIDSFPTDSTYQQDLPYGHFLKVYTHNHELKVDLTTVSPFEVFVLNNQTDLMIQVRDEDGKIVENAEVKLKNRKLRFHEASKAYRIGKSNQKGFLEVAYGGMSIYQELNKQYKNSRAKRTYRKVLGFAPIRYLWRPIRFWVGLPIDAVRSLVKHRATGSIYNAKTFPRRTWDFGKKIGHKFACIFDDDYCNDQKKAYRAVYFTSSKPKYFPKDTVRCKAYLVRGKNFKEVDDALEVVLRESYYGKEVLLFSIEPYQKNKGAYSFEFVLHDSLKLKLDMDYTILLKDKKGRTVAQHSIMHEDYELKSIKLAFRADNEKQYAKEPFKFYAKATNENELVLPDARLELVLLTQKTSLFLADYVFIPDTLWSYKIGLKPEGETEIALPDSIFPQVNLSYKAIATLKTSDNETKEQTLSVDYFRVEKSIDFEVETDSFQISYKEENKPTQGIAGIEITDAFGNVMQRFSSDLPAKIALNPYSRFVNAKVGNVQKRLDLRQKSSQVQAYSNRTADSLEITIQNPRNIPVSYQIYKQNKLIEQGNTSTLNWKQPVSNLQNYAISLQYIWAGEVKELNYEIPLREKQLTISMEQPALITPGQEVEMTVKVTDYKGEPVANADVLAYGLTTKFNTSTPSIKYLGKSRKSRKAYNSFSFGQKYRKSNMKDTLNYDRWNKQAGLDSIARYQFLYPKKKVYKFEYATADTFCQFAPFVVRGGQLQAIHIIEVDNKPVYFSWASDEMPYSFFVDHWKKYNYHQVRLRTEDREIIIDSVQIQPGKKLIFSIDDAHCTDSRVKIIKAPIKLTDKEQQRYHPYTAQYQNKYRGNFTYFKQGSHVFPANSIYNKFIGPFSQKEVELVVLDSFSLKFQHEPNYKYEFAPELLKMRSFESKILPSNLGYLSNALRTNLTDSVLTETAYVQQWQAYLESLKNQFNYANSGYTSKGRGRLSIDFPWVEASKKPNHILVMKVGEADFFRVYPGSNRIFHELEKGYYRLVFMQPNQQYFTADSVEINPNGLNFLRIDMPDTLKSDEFSQDFDKLLQNYIKQKQADYRRNYKEEAKFKQNVYNSYQKAVPCDGMTVANRTVMGVIKDEGGEPLPGATVTIKGTTCGSVADIDGKYSINVPEGSVLIFSFVGFDSREIVADNQSDIEAVLSAGMALEEVVVTGYGESLKMNYAASKSVVSYDLAGRAAGVKMDFLSNKNIDEEEKLFAKLEELEGGFNMVDSTLTDFISRKQLIIVDGMVYEGPYSAIDFSLVIDAQFLEGGDATALYGSRGAGGVLILSSKDGILKTELLKKEAEGSPFGGDDAEQVTINSIRSNFKDDAFWQPNLKTDANGIAKFKVTFPDDITKWQTYALAVGSKKETGSTTGQIKSFKPLMAQLALPRFLLAGDSAFAIGKTVNYGQDSANVSRSFEVNGKQVWQQDGWCKNALIDTLSLVPSNTDSLHVKYFMEKSDGYLDGEKRDIPVFPVGFERAEGEFMMLNADTSFTLGIQPRAETVTLRAETDVLDIAQSEVTKLRNYQYYCNEQLASKLRGFLAAKQIAQYRGEKFKLEGKIKEAIRKLEKRQQKTGAWGWWQNSATSYWISLHVVETLMEAKKLGYEVKIDAKALTDLLVWDLESTSPSQPIRKLKILQKLGAQVAYPKYLASLDSAEHNLLEALQIIELKQQLGMDYQLDSMRNKMKSTLFGNYYWSDYEMSNLRYYYGVYENPILTTLQAYKVLRNDSTDVAMLARIRNFFMEERRSGSWRNTYETAQILSTILPDWLGDREAKPAKLQLSGPVNKTITEFPYEVNLTAEDWAKGNLQISKSGDFPVYFTAYQRFWETKADTAKQDYFAVQTYFGDKASDSTLNLKAGNKITLTAKVEVKKSAEYIMVEIPIPAGCTYASKPNSFYREAHREYYRHKVSIFCEKLTAGTYTFTVELLPRYSGKYTLNPAKAEHMYFPIFYGNNELKKVKVE